jgi:hypothetical protein
MGLSVFFPGSSTGLARYVFILIMALCLAGCIEAADSPPPQADLQQGPVRREGVSPRGASVALASLSGVPEPVADRIKGAFAQEAAERDITLADPKNANYLVRGYLNAAPAETGTSITVVFDIFDAAKKRALRLEDALFIKAVPAADDPWSVMDVASVGDVAAKTAEDLAAFLTNTPEALAGAKTRTAAAPRQASPGADGQTIVRGTPAKPPAFEAKAPSDLSIAALR